MLAIILGILKFIGLLILGILGLFLAILLLVLLVPVRYRAHGSYFGALKGTAGVSWLLHILSCQVTYEGELDMCIRVFGIRLGGRKGASEPDEGERKDAGGSRKTRKDRGAEAGRDSAGRQKAGENQNPEENQNPGADQRPGEDRCPEVNHDAGEKQSREAVQGGEERAFLEENNKRPKKRKNKKFSLQELIKKIRVTFQGICDKLKALKDKKEQVLDFIGQEDNKNTFRLLKKQVTALLKHILPGKVKGRVRFGFDDPYTTGRILTWISPFYGLYAKKLQVIPVFDEKVLEGELELRGRIRIGTLIVIALRMFFDKNFRKLLKKWREA